MKEISIIYHDFTRNHKEISESRFLSYTCVYIYICFSLILRNLCIYLAFISFIAAVVITIQFLPLILDVIFPLDKARPRRLLITVEYFIIEINDRYFYIRVFHELIFFIICASMMFATATQLLAFACHIFGMFKIAR